MLNVIEAGNPDGVPALFVHGFMSSRLQWEPNESRLGVDLRMFMVELPGHGGSPVPDDASAMAPEVLLAELERVRDRIGIDRWWAVGHSMGGALCLQYALRHPDAIHGVVFTNSRAAFGVDASRPDGPREARLPEVERGQRLRHLPFHPIHAKRFRPDLQERMIGVADAMDVQTIRCVTEAVPAWQSRERLHELSAPTLLVNGRWESRFQPWVAEAEQRIADLTVVHLEGGHSINIEQPEGFDEAVLAFVRDRS